MRRYVTYVRVSTKEQGRSGLGLAAQQRDIDLFLQNYSDVPWEIIGAFQDIGSRRRQRPPRAAEGARPGPQDRRRAAGRQGRPSVAQGEPPGGAAWTTRRSRSASPRCRRPTSSRCTSTRALAEQERDFISIRTKAALQAAKAKGKKLGGARGNQAAMNAARKRKADAAALKVAGVIRPMREQGTILAGNRRSADRHGSRRSLDADEGFSRIGQVGVIVVHACPFAVPSLVLDLTTFRSGVLRDLGFQKRKRPPARRQVESFGLGPNPDLHAFERRRLHPSQSLEKSALARDEGAVKGAERRAYVAE